VAEIEKKKEVIVSLKYPACIGGSMVTAVAGEILKFVEGSTLMSVVRVFDEDGWRSTAALVWIHEDCVVSRQYVD
jgi:hypothetical protein